MTKELVVQLRDDIDGALGEDVVTRQFAFDGVAYEIELSDANHQEFCEYMEFYISHARKAKRVRPRKAAKKEPEKEPEKTPRPVRKEIREWAQQNGHDVKIRGNLSNEVRAAYDASGKDANG